jgi:LysR family glycine cleavage system transcriptional activator
MPRLTGFYAQCPDLSIETIATELVDPTGNCDTYILYLPEPPDGPTFITLFDEVLLPVCAPFAVDDKPLPKSLEELAQYTLIQGSTGQHQWAS